MTGLVFFMAGMVMFLAGGPFVLMALFDTSGRWRVRIVGLAGAAVATAGLVLLFRGIGFWYVGAP